MVSEPSLLDLAEDQQGCATQPVRLYRCGCVGVEPQTYAAQVELAPPGHMARTDGRGICVDVCLALEVQGLWRQGITTTGCCCGHNRHPPYIGVIPNDIPRMKLLGYEVAPNSCRPTAEDSFYPLSLRHDDTMYVDVRGDWSEWVHPLPGYTMECCSCGLIHEMEFAIVQREDDRPPNEGEIDERVIVFRAREIDSRVAQGSTSEQGPTLDGADPKIPPPNETP